MPLPASTEDDAHLCFVRGWAAFSAGELDAAVEAFTDALRLDPSFVQARVDRGSAYETSGDLAAALEDYSAAIALSPDDPWLYLLRGAVYLDIGDVAGALADYTTAISLAPGQALAYCRRGDVYRVANDLHAAIGDYTAALSIDPRQTLAYAGRAAARAELARAGKNVDGEDAGRTAALADYARYLELRPDAPDRPDVEAAIEELRRDM